MAAKGLAPDAPELLQPVVKSGWGGKLLAGILGLCVIWGLVAYGDELMNGLGVTGMRDYFSWGNYIATFIFFVGVAMAGTFISSVLKLSGATWSHPIARMGEVVTVVALLVGAPMVIVDMGRPDRLLNLLIHGRLASPLIWDVICLTTYLVGSILYLYLTLIPDMAAAYPYLEGRYPFRAKLYKTLASGWTGSPAQVKLYNRATQIMAVILIPVAIAMHTVTAFIFSMTLREGWHDAIMGPYYVVGAIYSGTAAIIVAMAIFTKVYHLEKYITWTHFRRMGYLMLTGGLVYLYMTFDEYITPSFDGTKAQQALSQSVFTGQFHGVFWSTILLTFVPVILVACARWTGKTGLIVGGILANIGMWLKRYLIIVPTLANPYLGIQGVPAQYAQYHMTWVEWSVSGGALAGFILLYFAFSKLFPIVSLWETRETTEQEVA
ncbi:MAG: NrfD/PsrC family molybdoenzyme membrane anchor subunit [Mycobacterium leprae]